MFISVIIPVYNNADSIHACLEAVFTSEYPEFEVIVVDDGSTDGSLQIARTFSCQVITSDTNRGAAAARNTGTKVAQGDILFFLDADILVEKNTLTLIAQSFQERPEISALFCSYQKETVPTNFFSVYKNLMHHYTHQISQEDAATFCAGYGAIKKEVFFKIGGFDENYRSLEDMELGYRMYQAGYRILLNKNILFTHCKYYSFWGLLKSDVLNRAIPWTKIMLDKKIYRADLNTKVNNVLSVPIAFLILFNLLFLPWFPKSWLLLFVLVGIFVSFNYDFFLFVFREQGWIFTWKTVVMTWFTYLYSGIGLLIGIFSFLKERLLLTKKP